MRALNAKISLSLSVAAVALALGTASEPASSAVCLWNGGNGAYASAGNWSCGAIPGGADDVSILAAGSIVNVVNAFAGTLNLGTGNIFNVTGGGTMWIQNQAITNNGTINIANGSDFRSNNGMVTVGGTGTFVLDDTAGVARIFGGGFTFGSGQTVRGSGQLGINSATFSNAGLISADVAGRTLSIDAAGASGAIGGGVGPTSDAGFYNSGTLQAMNGGNLAFEQGRYENSAAGQIRALNGSTVSLNNDSRFIGGTFTTAGTGAINSLSGTTYLQGVTLSTGSALNAVGSTIYLNNSFVNNGMLTVSAADLRMENAVTLTGTGTINLVPNGGSARIFGAPLTFASNHNITGSGQLGINSLIMTNNGTLTFSGGGNLSIDGSGASGALGGGGVGTGGNSALFNTAIIQATGAGSNISFEQGRYENAAGGVMLALNGASFTLNNDSRIVGGTLTSDATSMFKATSGTEYLSGVTLSSGSRLNLTGNTLFLDTTFTNNGTVNISGADLRNEGGLLSINGTGTMVLSNGARVYGGTITFGAGQTLQGTGQLGINSTILVINNVFSANSGTNLSIDVAGASGAIGGGVGANSDSGMLNNSIIQSTGGSTLSFEQGRYENGASGIVQALTGSTVQLNNDVRFIGGTFTTAGTGVVGSTSGTQYLQGLTLSAGSNYTASGSSLFLNSSFVNNGVLTVSNSDLRMENAVALSGIGTINLTGASARIYGAPLTFASNHNITGSGQLGVNSLIMTNNGTLTFSGGGNLSIDGSGASGPIGGGVGANADAAFYNTGILQATGSGTNISFEQGRYENAVGGIMRALNGASFTLNNDSRIVGGTLTSDATSMFKSNGGTEYLTNVTLSSGSRFNLGGNTLYLDTNFTNNGTLRVGSGSDLRNESGVVSINGTGVITLDDLTGGARFFSNALVLGAGQTVNGSGQIGINSMIFTNNGTITGSVAGRNLSIDVSGASGPIGGGLGVNGDSGMFNTGKIGAVAGASVSFEQGRYENGATGIFEALGAGASIAMNNDANLVNLDAGGVLSLGKYVSSTTGAASTLNLRSTIGNNLIGTIGTAKPGTDTVVTLSGINSVLTAFQSGTGTNVAIDSSLTGIAQSGRLELLGGRSMTIVAGGGAFSNAGVLQLGGGSFSATSFANSGLTTGFGSILLPVSNSGIVEAAGGTLATRAITGGGTLRSLAGATLDMSAAAGNSTAGFLTNNGALNIGSRNITVTSDYQNAGFGSGNAFNAHGNVSGSGLLLASSATMDLSGPALAGGVLNVGNVRTGGSSSTTLTITNNGTLTTLRGAVQNNNAPSVQLSSQNWVLNPNGGSAQITISYTGNAAGSLAGQSINILNNFDNVADSTIQISGNIYQVAQAGSIPASLTLQARRVGGPAATSVFNIANVAPVTPGFNEELFASGSVGGAFRLNGLSAFNATVDAGDSTGVTLSLGTGVAGAFSSIVNIANTSLAVAGSGLSDLALAGQSINVAGNVYAAAVKGISGNSVNFGAVRQGAADPSLNLTVSNSASGALTDQLVTTTGAMPAKISATAPGALNAGQSGLAVFTLDTATAGVVAGSGTLNFASHNNEMSDLSLGTETVNFSGTVTDLATASLFKNGGVGIFGGGGSLYTLDFGTLSADSGLFTTDLGVLNGNLGAIFSEVLDGAFTLNGGNPFNFAGSAFAGLMGGSSDTGNLLAFNTTGLAGGAYSTTLTFNGYSRYAGLADQALGPITLNINAQIQGGGGNPDPDPDPDPNPVPGAVPEPATWAMMILGFGLVGSMMRRRQTGAIVS